MYVSRPAERVGPGPLARHVIVGGCAIEHLVGLEVHLACSQANERRISPDVGEESLRCRAIVWIFKAVEAVPTGASHSRTKFIDQVWRQCGREIQRKQLRSAEALASETCRPWLEVRNAIGVFIGVCAAQFVALVEVVIDLEVDLFAGKIVGTIQAFVIEGKNAFVAILFATNPAIDRRYSGRRRPRSCSAEGIDAHELVDETGRIDSGPVRIPGTALVRRHRSSRLASERSTQDRRRSHSAAGL